MTPRTYREERDQDRAEARRRDRRDIAMYLQGACFAAVTIYWLLAITGGA
jgi:hypothetical protein